MKYAKSLVLAAVLALPVSLPAVAGDAGTSFLPTQTTNQYLAKDHLIGAKVTGKDAKIIGDVEDLIVSDTNTIVGVVMGTGGYLGFAEKKIGVDLTSLKFEEKDGKLTVSLPDVTDDMLKSAPAFQRSKPAKSLLDKAKEKVQELSDKTAASAKPAIEDAKHKAEDAYNKAKEAAVPALDAAKEKAKEAYDSAKSAIAPADKPAETTPPATEPKPQ